MEGTPGQDPSLPGTGVPHLEMRYPHLGMNYPLDRNGVPPQLGLGNPLSQDWLCCGWYASCGFPQKDFLVSFWFYLVVSSYFGFKRSKILVFPLLLVAGLGFVEQVKVIFNHLTPLTTTIHLQKPSFFATQLIFLEGKKSKKQQI